MQCRDRGYERKRGAVRDRGCFAPSIDPRATSPDPPSNRRARRCGIASKQEPIATEGRAGWRAAFLDVGDDQRVCTREASGERRGGGIAEAARLVLHEAGRGGRAATDRSTAGRMACTLRGRARQHTRGSALGTRGEGESSQRGQRAVGAWPTLHYSVLYSVLSPQSSVLG